MNAPRAPLFLRTKSRWIQGTLSFWATYKRNRPAVFGGVTFLIFAALAFLAPIIAPGNPLLIVAGPFQPPQTGAMKLLLGTDALGRSMFNDIIWGIRPSLLIGFSAMVVSLVLGSVIGGFAGYMGGRVDALLMRITEIFMILPRVVLAIVIAALYGGSLLNLILIIGGLSWPIPARLVRAEFLSLRETEFVEAARSIGQGTSRIIFSEILPNAAAPLIVNCSLIVGSAILIEAGLSFIGVGDTSIISLGGMLNTGSQTMIYAWWTAFFPGFVLLLIVLSVNLIGDGLNDALNPRRGEKMKT